MCVWTETIVRLKLEVWQQCSRWTRTTEGRDETANRCRGRTTEQTFTFCLARWLREPTVIVYQQQQQQHNDICRLLIDHRPTLYTPFNFCFSTLSNSRARPEDEEALLGWSSSHGESLTPAGCALHNAFRFYFRFPYEAPGRSSSVYLVKGRFRFLIFILESSGAPWHPQNLC